MADPWAEFSEPNKTGQDKRSSSSTAEGNNHDQNTGCDWGFSKGKADCGDETEDAVSNSSKFIPLYEKYLQDKMGVLKQQTENAKAYENDPQKALRDWFENEGHMFDYKLDKPTDNQYICRIELPIEDQDFTIASELNSDKRAAVHECCLFACKLLDNCQLLYSWQSGGREGDTNLKKKFDDANREDDIELDNTTTIKRYCATSHDGASSHHTYESLMAKWTELNMSILQSKAKLVKLDLSVKQQSKQVVASENADEEEEVDPLDEFMSNLSSKTELSRDDKIEKSRLKTQIAAYEREQEEVSRLIELAKPKFDLNKAVPQQKRQINNNT